MRRFALLVAVLAFVALPAVASSGSGWVRHQGEGFSVALPSSWIDEKDRGRLIREIRRIAADDPELASIMESLSNAREGNIAVKLIAFDLAKTSLATGFATNLNILRERSSVPLAVWRQSALEQLNRARFVIQPIWWQNVNLPAGKAVRFTYRARFGNVGGKQLHASLTQYALMHNGSAYVLTYTTLPKLAKAYRATFDRSARSLRLR